MKKALLVLVFLSLHSLIMQAGQRTFQTSGRNISQVYGQNGNLVFLYEKPDGGIFLGDSSIPAHRDPAFHTQTVSGNVCSPRLKQDQGGRLWMSWEQNHLGVLSAHLARLEKGVISHEGRVNLKGKGISHSPDFDFDPAGNIWVIWVSRSEERSRILVRDISRNLTWIVNDSSNLSAYTPRILVSPASNVWTFWVAQGGGSFRVCSRRFDGSCWSEVSELNLNTRHPHLSPAVSLDEFGNPWVVWSGYDGQDYEIWYTSRKGNAWLPARRITNNTILSDLYPTITFLPGNIPLITWSQQGSTSRILVKFRESGHWSPETCLVHDQGFNRNPQLALKEKNICLSWENVYHQTQMVKIEEFDFVEFSNRYSETISPEDRLPPNPDFMKKVSQQSLPLELAENQYIALGDSITYGVLARTWYPDKGYVPRLEILLKTWIDGARVLNRGVPGEQTWEGLARLDDVLQESGSKYILIMEGTNDMTGGIPSETAAFNLEEMVKKCLDTGVFPLVATVIPRSDSLWNQRVKLPTLELNQLIRQMILSYSLPLVDQYDVFTGYPEGYLALFSDGAHPNETGYQLMAEAWFEHIQDIPYPPIDLRVERKLNQILFYDEHLNLLFWEANPLWKSDPQVSVLHIHRRPQNDSAAGFELINAATPGIFQYIDRDIERDKKYLYFIQAEDPNGVKGPISRVVSDR
jgi:lysophospholipase L1-like esterase